MGKENRSRFGKIIGIRQYGSGEPDMGDDDRIATVHDRSGRHHVDSAQEKTRWKRLTAFIT